MNKPRRYVTRRVRKFIKNLDHSYFLFKYGINDNFFSIPNIYNSYYAGFIAGDGCIYDNHLKIKIAKYDVKLLEQFIVDTEATYKILDYNIENDNHSDQSVLVITSQKIIDDLLLNFKISSNKSLTMSPPDLTKENSVSFLIGLIDSDGWMYYDTRNVLQFGLCGTQDTIRWANSIFSEVVPPNLIRSTSSEKIYRVTYGGQTALRLVRFLSNFKTPFKLPRKWECQPTGKVA